MSDSWYCRMKGQVKGPISLSELQELALSGKLQLTDFVRREEKASWSVARDVPQIWETVPHAIVSGDAMPQIDDLAFAPATEIAPPQSTARAAPSPLRPGSPPPDPRTKAGGKASLPAAKSDASARKAAAPKPKVPLAVLIGSGIAFAVVVFIGLSFLVGSGSTSVEDVLKQNAAQHNKRLPRQIDPEVRFDSVTAGPGRKMTLRYTMTKLEGEKLDFVAEERATAIKAAAIKLFRSSKESDYYRVNKVQVECSLCNKNKREVSTILIKPGEY